MKSIMIKAGMFVSGIAMACAMSVGSAGAQERAGQQAGDGEVLRGEPRAQPLRLGMATLDQRQVRA